MPHIRLLCMFAGLALIADVRIANAEPPTIAYTFPAGGQRGTAVDVRIGGHFLHDKAEFLMTGPGVQAASTIERMNTVWFEGPLIKQPASQQKEDYPKDYLNRIEIAADAPLGVRFFYAGTSQGLTPPERFVIGDLPEIIEDELNGSSETNKVALPVTVNGRIFPREDVDDWLFAAKAGQVITCEVNAARIGSGLDSRLEVRDPKGRLIAENSDYFGLDSFVRFTAPEDGHYTVRIHDIRFDGLQHFVYRLTISPGAWLDHVYPLGGRRGSAVSLQLFGANLASDRVEFAVPADAAAIVEKPGLTEAAGLLSNALFATDDLPEHLETEPNDETAQAKAIELPALVNGRIAQPSDVDLWTFAGKKGDTWQFDLKASRLGSKLDGVLTLLGPLDKQIATADDLANGQTDCVLTATLPEDGNYTLRIEDRLGSRGGPEFAYRVRIGSVRETPLRLTLPVDAVTLLRGNEVRVKLLAERPQSFADEIPLSVENLPEGVTVANDLKLAKGQNQIDFVVKADANAKVATSRLRVVGKWKVGEEERSTVAMVQRQPGDPSSSELRLRVGLPTPFKLKGIFETKYVPRGSVFTRRCRVERNGFTGPLWVEIADRQARHLQGVTGPRLTIPADVSEIEYPFSLPPWMEVGRTSRSCLAILGEITEPDGSKHLVSHTSQEQNEQAIVIVEPNRLSLETTQATVRRVAGSEVRIPIRVSRATGLRGVVRIEGSMPPHVRDVRVDPVELPDGTAVGEVTFRFDATPTPLAAGDGTSPASVRVKLRATMLDERGLPVIDEIDVRVIDAP
jgi:pre-peptidase